MVKGKNENVNRIISFFSSFPTGLFFTVLIGAILITSGSAATHVFAANQPATALPSCTDPTGQNLPCMMVISTLPPPTNAIQCQETSGQILPCSYATQNLNNGEQVVVITVYVPANYVFSGYGPWTVVKQVVHETITKKEIVRVQPPCESPDADAKTDLDKNLTTRDCDLTDANEHGKVPGCESPDNTAKSDLDNGLKTKDCDLGDANEHKAPCERPDADAKTDLDKNLKTIDCDLADPNEHGKTPLPILSCNSANNNGTCSPTNNTKNSESGGSGAGTTCVNNCTAGTPPPVDCTKNPADPSCSQTLTPSTTTPTTKTCPDGSVIDSSATCPTQPNPSNPNSQNPPPSETNPPPSSSDNGNNNPNKGDNNNGGNPP
jgi:hypothetical protein